MVQELIHAKEKLNYELWRHLKVFAFTIESFNISRMFYETGIEVDAKSRFEGFSIEPYDNNSIDTKKILSPFLPPNKQVSIGEFCSSLNKSNNNNIYSLIAEDFLLELISIFEDFLISTIRVLLNNKPEIAFSNDYQISASDLLKYSSLEELKELIIEDKLKKITYKSLRNIFSYLENGFKIKFNIESESLNKIYFWKEVRNIITHNRSIVSSLFINNLDKNGIKVNYVIGSRFEVEIDEVVSFAECIKKVSDTMYSTLTGEANIELVFDGLIEERTGSYISPKPKTRLNIGRNDPCFCGSGLKYKKCCYPRLA